MAENKTGLSNLARRVITAAIILPLFILLTLKGTFLQFWIFASLVILGATYEFYRLLEQGGIECYSWLGLGLTLLLNMTTGGGRAAFTAIIICPWLYALRDKRDTTLIFPSVMGTVLGVFYVSWMLNHVIWLKSYHSQGGELILWLCAMVWGCDTAAYFAGGAWGKHLLAPKLSPKKTLEGAVGGLLASLIVAWAFGPWFFKATFPMATLMGLAIGIVSQLSDLCESLVKRWANAKDSGTILPGHGGVLDRADSLLFSAPVFYYLVKVCLRCA